MKFTVAYDGSRYFGWQKTKTGPSIQEEIEKAVYQMTQMKVQPEAASRTDRGVHAEGQVVHFALDRDPKKTMGGLNAHLPSDIRIIKAEAVSPSFHPTLDAKGKEYHYRLCLGPVQEPMNRLYSWHFERPLDIGKMVQAASDLLGSHDFSALANERAARPGYLSICGKKLAAPFRSGESPSLQEGVLQKEENPICTLESIEITELPRKRLQISIRGDRFLYKMARTIAGTLVYIGCGKLSLGCIPSLLASKDRRLAGISAPARGLFLHKVFYDL